MSRRKAGAANRSGGTRRFSGDCLREARERAGLRREDVTVSARCGFSSLCSWEAGRTVPNANSLARVADAVGVALDDLFVREHE